MERLLIYVFVSIIFTGLLNWILYTRKKPYYQSAYSSFLILLGLIVLLKPLGYLFSNVVLLVLGIIPLLPLWLHSIITSIVIRQELKKGMIDEDKWAFRGTLCLFTFLFEIIYVPIFILINLLLSMSPTMLG